MIRSASQFGYTLVELIIVISIAAVLAAMAFPATTSRDGDALALAADEVARALRFAHGEAMRTGQPYGFQADADRRLRVFRLDVDLTPPTPIYDVVDPVSRRLYDISLDDHPLAATDALDVGSEFRSTCSQPDRVYFDGNGTPWCTNPAGVLLRSYDVRLTLGTRSLTISAGAMTGRVSVQ